MSKALIGAAVVIGAAVFAKRRVTSSGRFDFETWIGRMPDNAPPKSMFPTSARSARTPTGSWNSLRATTRPTLTRYRCLRSDDLGAPQARATITRPEALRPCLEPPAEARGHRSSVARSDTGYRLTLGAREASGTPNAAARPLQSDSGCSRTCRCRDRAGIPAEAPWRSTRCARRSPRRYAPTAWFCASPVPVLCTTAYLGAGTEAYLVPVTTTRGGLGRSF